MEETPTTASDNTGEQTPAADHVAYAAHTQAEILYKAGVKSIESFVLAAYKQGDENAKLKALNDALSTGLAVAAFKGRLKQKVSADIAALQADRKRAREESEDDEAFDLTSRIIENQGFLKLIDETE